MDEIKVTLHEGTEKLEVRTGLLPTAIELVKLEPSGDIHAVANYIAGKSLPTDEMKKDLDTFIFVNDNEQMITLGIRLQHPHRVVVNSKLDKTLEFKSFKIETSERWTMPALKQHIRVNRSFFPDKEAWNKLMVNLGQLDVKIQEAIKDESDDRGNKLQHFETKVISNIDERFTLEMPIYKGLPSVKFEVNILFERREKGVSMWLESTEALEIMRSQWKEVSEDYIKSFRGLGFTVINK